MSPINPNHLLGSRSNPQQQDRGFTLNYSSHSLTHSLTVVGRWPTEQQDTKWQRVFVKIFCTFTRPLNPDGIRATHSLGGWLWTHSQFLFMASSNTCSASSPQPYYSVAVATSLHNNLQFTVNWWDSHIHWLSPCTQPLTHTLRHWSCTPLFHTRPQSLDSSTAVPIKLYGQAVKLERHWWTTAITDVHPAIGFFYSG